MPALRFAPSALRLALPSHVLIWTDLALEVVAMIGALAIVFGVMGRFSTHHPRCRRCRADLRELACSLEPDHARAADGIVCPACAVGLDRPRAIRWRPFPVRRGAVAVGVATLLLALGARSYGVSLARRGLFWSDLAPAQPLVDRVSASPATVSTDDWAALSRRVSAGWLTDAQVDALLDAIERPASGPTRVVSPRGAGLAPARANFTPMSPSASAVSGFLRSALETERDPARIARLWSSLDPLPRPRVEVRGTLDNRWELDVDLPDTWNRYHRHLAGDPLSRFRELTSVRAVTEVRLDGQPAPTLRAWSDLAPMPAEHLSGGPSASLRWIIKAEGHSPGTSLLLEIDIASAPIDPDFMAALVRASGYPGQPERWGPHPAIVRRTLSTTVVLPGGRENADAPQAAPAGDGVPSEVEP